jgi:hypothetical protein
MSHILGVYQTMLRMSSLIDFCFRIFAVTFGCHSLVRDLSTLRLSLSLVKVLLSVFKWFVKCTNLFCKLRIDYLGYIRNNSYSWLNVFNLDLLTFVILSCVSTKVSQISFVVVHVEIQKNSFMSRAPQRRFIIFLS